MKKLERRKESGFSDKRFYNHRPSLLGVFDKVWTDFKPDAMAKTSLRVTQNVTGPKNCEKVELWQSLKPQLGASRKTSLKPCSPIYRYLGGAGMQRPECCKISLCKQSHFK
ncbi:hypothetical protein B9G79_05780 [Bdellovibrio bacteriovorus]|uniref:Uncharacterized protein n=1 Tax=Bdellovibrio bacteriovorus TaxID=959 RepID=A0A1Z3N6J5_BDEBC|nr:hypothetical protein B9G79_05780 [Bdellovibrio bacteriovorus]